MAPKFILPAVAAQVALGLISVVAFADVTGTTGGGQPHSNDQPSLGITYLVALQGSLPSRSPPSNAALNLGDIIMFAGNFTPGGFAMAQGQSLSINQNQPLFELYGTTYGGNGQTTFALPNLKDSVPIDTGQRAGLSNYPLGSVIG